MKRILRIPVKNLFGDPMHIEEKNASPWNIFRNLFDLKKCKYVDFTESEEIAEKSIMFTDSTDETW